jgi:colanic acid biosynthesis glycosyl transferase WcaI
MRLVLSHPIPATNVSPTVTEPAARGIQPKGGSSRILFLNQFVPPDPAPTARLLGEVAAELGRRGFETVLVGDALDYRGGKTILGSRALREGLSLLRLLGRTLVAPRAEAIVVLTSPPMVPVVAWLARIRHRRARLIHWAMDLYPEVAVAVGEVGEGSRLHRITAALMRRVYATCDLVVVLDREMAQRIGPLPRRVETEPPWPPEPTLFTLPTGATGETTPAFTWLYSGNLGRAHDWRTLLEAQALVEARGLEVDLVFQGGGAERAAAMAEAKARGLQRCFWRDYAPEADLVPSLLLADALVATQRPETAGCLWPSKLALAVLVGRPVLWVGSKDGGVAEWLRERGHFAVSPDEPQALADEIERLTKTTRRSESPSPDELAARISLARSEGIARVADWIDDAIDDRRSIRT